MAGITTPRSASYDALLSTTLDKYYKSGKMHDAIFNSNPTFAAFKEKKRMQYADGGYQVAVNLMYGTNTTVGSYSRYEVLDVAPQDGITQAFYPWAQYAGAVSIDGLSEFQNSGAGKIIDLLGAKVEQTTMTFGEEINKHLMDLENITLSTSTTGNSGKNIQGLPCMIHLAPNTTNTYGGITNTSGAYDWWESQLFTHATDTWAGVFYGMMRTYNLCTKGSGGSPDLIITDMGSYEHYEQYMSDKKRYLKSDRATAGFEAVYFKGAKMFWDTHMPDTTTEVNYDSGSWTEGAMFFLNSKFCKLIIGKGRDFKPGKFQSPEDQDAKTALYRAYLQLVCSNRRKQGLYTGIEETLTA